MKKTTLNALLRAADNLRDVVLEYCEDTLSTDRPTADMCKALDQFDRLRKGTRPGKGGVL